MIMLHIFIWLHNTFFVEMGARVLLRKTAGSAIELDVKQIYAD